MFNKNFRLRNPDYTIEGTNGYQTFYWVEDSWDMLNNLKNEFNNAGYTPTTCLYEDRPAIKYLFKK